MAYPKTPNSGRGAPALDLDDLPARAPKAARAAAPGPTPRGPLPPGTSKPALAKPGKKPNFRKKAPPPTSPPLRKADSGASPNDRLAAQLTSRLRQRDTRLG